MSLLRRYLLLASFIGTFAEQMITPLYGIFVKSYGGGILDAGLPFALFGIISGLIVIFAGKCKWFNEQPHTVVMFGFIIASFGDFGYFFVHNTFQLCIVQILLGVSVGLLNPAWDALYTENTEEGKGYEAWSLWGGGANISVGLAALVGTFITSWLGFKAMFISTALVNTVAVWYSVRVYQIEKQKPTTS